MTKLRASIELMDLPPSPQNKYVLARSPRNAWIDFARWTITYKVLFDYIEHHIEVPSAYSVGVSLENAHICSHLVVFPLSLASDPT
jgi:hypothetical protein